MPLEMGTPEKSQTFDVCTACLSSSSVKNLGFLTRWCAGAYILPQLLIKSTPSEAGNRFLCVKICFPNPSLTH